MHLVLYSYYNDVSKQLNPNWENNNTYMSENESSDKKRQDFRNILNLKYLRQF